MTFKPHAAGSSLILATGIVAGLVASFVPLAIETVRLFECRQRRYSPQVTRWAAECLGMTVASVLDAAERGNVPCIRLRAAIRFDPIAIKARVRARSTQSGAPIEIDATPTTKELRALRADVRALASASDLAVSADEAARRLGCGRTRVFELLKQRVLSPAKSYGRRTMLLAASVERLLADGAMPVPHPRRRPATQIEAEILSLKP
jgi:hypothetical protein